MNWIILLLAGLFEVSLTFCLGKARSASGFEYYLWGSGFLASTVLSMALLAKAVRTLPLGTAYAVWTGIGAVGTVLDFKLSQYSLSSVLVNFAIS
uniref:DMT family transporter n=1 Tax=Bacteroides acidifaciens TaxID=85831 RepID=UPI0025A4D34B